MIRQLLVTAMTATVAMGLAMTGQTASQTQGQTGGAAASKPAANIVIPVPRSSPTDGKRMFASYCAPCHGADGKGRGPAAPALKVQPVDLTLLSQNNHGKFPSAHIVAVLQFGSEMPAHGSAQMPVWGPILKNMDRGSDQEKQLRIGNLTEFLRSIQVK